MSRKADPYAILDKDRRRHPVATMLAALAVLIVFLALLAYLISSTGDDDPLPRAPGGNAPHQP